MSGVDGISDDVELIQVHIKNPDSEYEQLSSVEMDVEEGNESTNASRRRLVLSVGGGHHSDTPEPYGLVGKPPHQGVIWAERKPALGYWLHGFESSGIPIESVREEHPDLVAEWAEWADSLSERDRKLRCMDMLEHRVEMDDWLAERYLEEGAVWRATDAGEPASEWAAQLARQYDPQPKMCYYTAQRAALIHEDNHRVSYVEGVALPAQASHAVPHAWIEYEGNVIELTWPWHWFDGQEAVYFGLEIPTEEVAKAREDRAHGGPVILPEEEVAKRARMMRGDDLPD